MRQATGALRQAGNHFAREGWVLVFLAVVALAMAGSAAAAEPETATIAVEASDFLSGEPLPDICVQITSDDPSGFWDQGETGPDGRVSFGVPAGTYNVIVHDCYRFAYSQESFGPFTLAAGEMITLGASLHPPVTVTGAVTDAATGDPLFRMCVELQEEDESYPERRVLTNAVGIYTVTVPGGNYFMGFSDCGDGEYVDRWRESAPRSADPRPVDLTGATEFVVDSPLTPAGFISGTVTDELTGNPAPGICVSARGADPTAGGEVDDTTGPDGEYRLTGRIAGDYVVYFRDCRGGDLVSEYYADAAVEEDATPVTVSSGVTTTVDVALAPGGHISGTIVDADTGDPLDDICVWLQDPDGRLEGGLRVTRTDGLGHYEFRVVRPGTYRVLFAPLWCSSSVYTQQFYDNVTDVADVTLIEVGPAAVITGIDGALIVGGTISGTVTDEAGDPIDGFVEVHHEDWEFPIGDSVRNGEFTVDALPVGEYDVRFSSGWMYLPEWYDDALTQEDATPVSILTEGANVTGIDARLSESGQVRGTVIGLQYPDEIQCVNVYELDGTFNRTGHTGPDGRFHIGGFATGQYRMNTSPCQSYSPGSYLTIWYGGSLTAAESTLVEITAGQTTWNIDFQPTKFPGFDADATVALVEGSGRWHTIDGDADGVTLYFGLPTDVPVLGDWDCDGEETPGMFRPTNGFFYLTNSRVTSVADQEFFFGQGGDVPLAGDWNGDGCDTVGVYRPAEGKVYLRNSLTTGVADIEYYFGQPGDTPFAGDFDGNGIDEVALHRPSTGRAYLRLSHTTGTADLDFYYGIAGDRIFTGDWNGDGTDTLAVYRPESADVFLSFTNATGPADAEFRFGDGSLRPAT